MTDMLVDDFKLAMRRLAAAVTIITTASGGERTGMTATAVTAVSTDPPSLLISVNRNASLYEAVVGSGSFCVNLLTPSHNELVHPFSGKSKGEARFALGQWEGHELGPPFLKDALASIICRVDATFPYASHMLFIGRVEAVRMAGGPEPLLWHEGQGASTYPLAGSSLLAGRVAAAPQA
jgi:flavin reductase